MTIVHFRGRLLPSEPKLSIEGLPPVRWDEPSFDLPTTFTIRIVQSAVDIECDVNRYQENDLAPLLTRALDLARAAVDTYCFSTGVGLTVFLDLFIKPDGTESNIFNKNPHVAELCTSFDIDFGTVWNLLIREPPLFMAMNDLIVSITLPHHAAVNCARAIEGIRNLVIPRGVDRKEGWRLLRQNLNVEQNYLSFITDQSKGPRHGDRTHIPADPLNETLKRSWIVMNRFLEFRKRGDQPLPLVEFPFLTDQFS